MDDKEQQQRDRAYRIWDDEGRPEGRHEDHWKRAGNENDISDQEAADIADANIEAAEKFNGKNDKLQDTVDIRPPSAISPD
jgi:hypothetical protein